MSTPESFYSCEEFQSTLEDYLDQELPLAETRLMLAHVETCASCAESSRRQYEALAEMRDVIQRQPLPPGLAERLWRHLADRHFAP